MWFPERRRKALELRKLRATAELEVLNKVSIDTTYLMSRVIDAKKELVEVEYLLQQFDK